MKKQYLLYIKILLINIALNNLNLGIKTSNEIIYL